MQNQLELVDKTKNLEQAEHDNAYNLRNRRSIRAPSYEASIAIFDEPTIFIEAITGENASQ
jgi:hypothetical protein